MDELSRAPAGGFGAGESLIAHPSPSFVYRLPAEPAPGVPLQHRFVAGGEVLLRHSVEDARDHHLAVRSRLRPEHLSIQSGPPAMLASTYGSAGEGQQVSNAEVRPR